MNRISYRLIALLVCARAGTALAAADYDVEYRLDAAPAEGQVTVSMRVTQSTVLLRQVRFVNVGERYGKFDGDGTWRRDGDEVTWLVPARGGTLSWSVSVPHRRGKDSYDAWLDTDWGLFRAEDVIPRAATRTVPGAESRTSMRFDVPPKWSVITEYENNDGRYAVSKPDRRFDQPGGWIVMGRLGVRRDRIAGTDVVVAAPVNTGFDRLEILSILNWTLPELARVVPRMPQRIAIVGAAEPMWRGGLSAPRSLFLHSDRPLVSENGTSTLLHEIMHLALDLRGARDSDWIIEGLAEYYSIRLIYRSGGMSRSRLAKIMASQREWADDAGELCDGPSTGATTALAVQILARLDREIRKTTDGRQSLDDVVATLIRRGADVNLSRLESAAADLLDDEPEALQVDAVDRCRDTDADD